MNDKKEKIIAFSIGLIITFLLLEIFLRVMGSSYQSNISSPKKGYFSGRTDNYTILCLGNSFTYGVGAPKGESYPDWLQKLFDQSTKGINIIVLNGGIPNLNTSELLMRLRGDIERTHPKMIILQTGTPNLWNTHYFNKYLERKHNRDDFFRSVLARLNDFLYRSRVYRLILRVSFDTRQAGDNRSRHYSNQDDDYKSSVATWWKLKLAYLNRKETIVSEQDIKKAIGTFERKTRDDPDYPPNYQYIGDIYCRLNKFKEAVDWYIKGVNSSPDYRDESDINYNYFGLREVLQLTDDESIKSRINQFISQLPGNSDKGFKEILSLTREGFRDWLESDLREIIRICRAENIKIVFQNYPVIFPTGYRYVKGVNLILYRVAEENKIPFVDNEKVFRGLVDSSGNAGGYFNNDADGLGHCNASGYKIMALNVYNKIKEEVSRNSGQNKQ